MSENTNATVDTTATVPATTTVISSGAGTSATGDNRKAVATRRSPAKSTGKAPAKSAGKAPAKRTAQTGKAAAPVKTTAKPAAGELTKTAKNRIIAAEMVKIVADALGKWNPKRHSGITAEEAAQGMASWLNYAPVQTESWDPRLPARSGVGGRGAKDRKVA